MLFCGLIEAAPPGCRRDSAKVARSRRERTTKRGHRTALARAMLFCGLIEAAPPGCRRDSAKVGRSRRERTTKRGPRTVLARAMLYCGLIEAAPPGFRRDSAKVARSRRERPTKRGPRSLSGLVERFRVNMWMSWNCANGMLWVAEQINRENSNVRLSVS